MCIRDRPRSSRRCAETATAIVDNLLDRVVAAGVPAEQVEKAPKDPLGPEPVLTMNRKDGMNGYLPEPA